jgi:hypothetical protein
LVRKWTKRSPSIRLNSCNGWWKRFSRSMSCLLSLMSRFDSWRMSWVSLKGVCLSIIQMQNHTHISGRIQFQSSSKSTPNAFIRICTSKMKRHLKMIQNDYIWSSLHFQYGDMQQLINCFQPSGMHNQHRLISEIQWCITLKQCHKGVLWNSWDNIK